MDIIVSVVCPIYNEEKYIGKCIDSILAQDYPKDKIEVLFVDGMSTDKTQEIVQSYSQQYSFIRLLLNPNKTVPYAMNKGINEAKGEVIIRLDAHAAYASNYISVLVRYLKELDADNVGSPCRTDVLNKNKKSLAIKESLSNKFGVGNSQFRLGVEKIMEVDTVPFGCWKKNTFEKYGFFDERLTRNQDMELNKRILRNGGKIFLIPDTYSIYYARETYKSVSKNAYLNGVWNILTIFYTGEKDSLSLRHFIPLIFVSSVIFPLLFIPIWIPVITVSLVSLSSYMLLFSFICLSLTLKKKLSFFHLIGAFVSLHIPYGIGSIVGIIKGIKKRLLRK